MNTNVLQIDANSSMEQAAEKMRTGGHSAAPVVDESGRCVGMLSASDFLKRECGGRPWLDDPPAAGSQPATDSPHNYDEETPDYVNRFMHPAVQSVSSDASLMQAANIMCSAHVHRLPVLDSQGRPIGIVSSMDVVAAMLNAMDELNVEQLNRAQQ